jgi:hypothetical protein
MRCLQAACDTIVLLCHRPGAQLCDSPAAAPFCLYGVQQLAVTLLLLALLLLWRPSKSSLLASCVCCCSGGENQTL